MTPQKPPLKLIGPDATIPEPPRALGPAGMQLWQRIQTEFSIRDAGGVELLTLAAQALDRAESLSAAIATEGETIVTKSGIRSHPALRDELQNVNILSRFFCKRSTSFDATSLLTAQSASRP